MQTKKPNKKMVLQIFEKCKLLLIVSFICNLEIYTQYEHVISKKKVFNFSIIPIIKNLIIELPRRHSLKYANMDRWLNLFSGAQGITPGPGFSLHGLEPVIQNIYIYMYVCRYICMYVCRYVCMYVFGDKAIPRFAVHASMSTDGVCVSELLTLVEVSRGVGRAHEQDKD